MYKKPSIKKISVQPNMLGTLFATVAVVIVT